MRSLKIVRPYANAAILDRTNADFGTAAMTNPNALLTADPREVATLNAATSSILLDLGEPKAVDTLYFGANTLGGSAFVFQAYVSNDPTFASGVITLYSGFAGDNSLAASPVASNPSQTHSVLQFNPGVGRYVLIRITGTGSIGVIAAGLSFSARWGQEYGAGRALADRSNVENLPLGGFGIDKGAITSGYQWTFGDLQSSEVKALFDVLRGVGTSRPILVIEDPDFVYDTPTVFGSATISGNNKIVTKTGGGSAYNAGVGFAFRDGLATGMSFKASYVTGGRLAGFWPLANGGGTYAYAIETSGNNVNRYTPAGGALVSTYVAGDRFSLKYEEGTQRFVTTQNGVIIDAYPAATALGLFPAALLKADSGPADKIEELNVYDLGYSDRIHWGLLNKIDVYERLDPANTRWSLSVGDWL